MQVSKVLMFNKEFENVPSRSNKAKITLIRTSSNYIMLYAHHEDIDVQEYSNEEALLTDLDNSISLERSIENMEYVEGLLNMKSQIKEAIGL